MTCLICNDEGWVCENHPDKSWGEGHDCCEGAGMPCACNKSDTPKVNWKEIICETK